MGRRGALSLVLLVIVGAVVFFAARGRDDVPHVAVSAPASPQDATATEPDPRAVPRPRAAAPDPAEDDVRPVDGDVAGEPDPPATDDPERWRVTFLGRDDAPAPGLRLRVRTGEKTVYVLTDATGTAAIPCAAGAAELDLELPGFRGLGAEGGQARRAKLTERGATLRLPEIPSLRVVTVDAETGRPLAADVLIRIGATTVAEVRSPATIAPAPFATDPYGFAVELRPPEGYAASRAPLLVSVPIARFARTLELAIPLRREVPWRVRVVDADDAPVDDASILTVALGTSVFSPLSERTATAGELRVHGVPFLRGESLLVGVMRDDGEHFWVGSSDPVVLREPVAPIVTVVRLPREPAGTRSETGIGGGAGGAFGGRRGGRRSLGTSDRSAAIVVHVERRSGASAAGAEVRLDGGATAYTDAAGDVRFESLRPGAYVVRVAERGIVPASASVTVASGEIGRVVLREPEGSRLDVQVLDEEGQSLPFAAVEVQVRGADGAWFGHVELDGDTQVLTPREHVAIPGDASALRLTDAAGRLALIHVPAGDVRIRAWFGSRSASASASAPGWATLRLGSSD